MGKLLPADDLAYQSPRQQFASWLILALGMIIPGVLLAVYPSFWTTHALGIMLGIAPLAVSVIGVVVAVAGVASLFFHDRDIPYAVGIVFYLAIGVVCFIALCQGIQIGALFMTPALVAWLYYVATQFTSQRVVERDEEE